MLSFVWREGEFLQVSIQVIAQRPDPSIPDKNIFWWTKPNKITIPTIRDLFTNPSQYLSAIEPIERYNLFYTVHENQEHIRPRQFKQTNTLIFDIDNILKGREQDYIDVVTEVLQIPHGEQIAWVSSGNGLHAIIMLDSYVTDPSFFKRHKDQYSAICEKMSEALAEQRLTYVDDLTGKMIGKPDPSVFDNARVLRMPGTINRKPGRPDTECRLITGAMSPIAWDWEKVSGIPSLKDDLLASNSESVSAEFEEVFGVPDTNAVLDGCEFLKHAKKDASILPEPEWHKAVNLLGRLENGVVLVHEYSKEHPKYSSVETNRKIQQVLTKSRAFKCETINREWGKCHTCTHFNKVVTPLQIVSADFIKTAQSGFWQRDSKGKPKQPAYEDLRRDFERRHRYLVIEESEAVYTYGLTHWSNFSQTKMKAFVQQSLNPIPSNQHCNEFVGLIKRTNIKPVTWLADSSKKKINLQNGVYDIVTGQFTEHRPEYGMTSILPFNYDPKAECPRFETFMMEVTNNNHEDIETLMEFVGYCISGDDYWLHNCLMLLGEGRNGKSLFLRIVQALMGQDYYSSVSLKDFGDPQHRALMNNKLMNICEETPEESLLESSDFAAITSGAMMTIKEVYCKPIQVRNRAKIIFASMNMPKIKNVGTAIMERMLPVKFTQEFTQENGKQDPHLFEKLIPEMPGILNWAIKAYKNLKARRKFHRSDSIKKNSEELLSENDTAYTYFKTCLEVKEISEEGNFKHDVYEDYQIWCKKSGKHHCADTLFWKRLRKHIKNLDERFIRQRTDSRREKVRGVFILSDVESVLPFTSQNWK